jgi:uncharacterized membrane protein YgcG
MMLLYDFVREEAAAPEARRTAAEALVRLGLLRREPRGPSLMFLWLAAMTTVVVVIGAASIVGPAGAVVVAVLAVALGVVALRRRADRGPADVYIGPEGERISVGRDMGAAGGGGASWFDGWGEGGGANGGGGGNGGGGL